MLPSAADAINLPSASEAMIPTPTETPGAYTPPLDVQYGPFTETARVFCIIGIILTIES